MEQDHSAILRQPSYFIFWVLWFLATAGYGAVWAAVIYIWGNETPFGAYFALSGGLWLGILQGLVLRRYLSARYWWTWIISSIAGWLCAMLFLIMGLLFASVGAGLNNTDTRYWGFWLYCLGGAAFGLMQAGFFLGRKFEGFSTMWAITNAFAWAVGGLLGGLASFAVYGPMSFGYEWDTNSFHDALHIALGILIATSVVGAITGIVAVLHLWLHSETSS